MPENRNHEGYPDPTACEAINNVELERYKRQISGARARVAGDYFERQIEGSLNWHFERGLLKATKTPEPMKPVSKPNNRGQFLAHYVKAAQVDFCGTMYGGRSVRFEAKQTDTDRFARNRLTDEQMNDLRDHQKLGALCFVLLCFGYDRFYRVPWRVWRDMKKIYGRQYVTEMDLQQFRIPFTCGVIKILHGIIDIHEAGEHSNPLPLPDICVVCGKYAGEGSQVCPNCQKEGETPWHPKQSQTMQK